MKKFKFWCKGTSLNPNFNKPSWWTFPNYLLQKYFPGLRIFESLDFETCQWTGFIDGNGRDVYEGDILMWEGIYKCGAIEFSKGSFIVFINDMIFNLWALFNSHCDDLKIVGNKFENSELLK